MLTVRVCFPIKALIQINLNDHTQRNDEQGAPPCVLSSSLSCLLLPLLRCPSFFHPMASLIVSITSSVHQCNTPPPPPPPVISHCTFLRNVSKQPMLNVEKVNVKSKTATVQTRPCSAGDSVVSISSVSAQTQHHGRKRATHHSYRTQPPLN